MNHREDDTEPLGEAPDIAGAALPKTFDLADAITQGGLTDTDKTVRVEPDDEVGEVPADGTTVVGEGSKVGSVYRLDDGRLVYVVEGR